MAKTGENGIWRTLTCMNDLVWKIESNKINAAARAHTPGHYA